jgi:proteasome lid subunit RPN8/RPN11
VDTGVAEQHDIDANEITVEGLTEKEFPAVSPFRVVISEQAHQKMWGHARSTLADGDLIKEVGGILVGNLFRDEKGPYLEVSGSIVAEHTRNEGTEVAFTPETWAQVNRVKDMEFPSERIVGWYHTHPNFGIFLSERDQFLHRHSFPQPWAVAYVIDPVQDLEGLFVWKAGQPREAHEYWVGTDKRSGQAVRPPDTAVVGPAAVEAVPSRASWLVPYAVALVVVLMVTIMTYAREMTRSERDMLIIRALESEKMELDRAFQILRALRSEVERVSKQSTADIAELKGQAEQLEGGLNQLNTITKSLQHRIQGQQEAQPAEGGAQHE